MLPLLLAVVAIPSSTHDDYGVLLDPPPRVLFFTHSAGFVHDVVKRPSPDALSPAEQLFTDFAGKRFAVTCSQDCADISAANLAKYAAVVFMTTSTQEKDLPVPGNGNQELVDWVRHGGAFVGLHCATDTNYNFAPYVAMIGGTFDGHPWHEEIAVRVEDDRLPSLETTHLMKRALRSQQSTGSSPEEALKAAVNLGRSFSITDEIYQFKNFRRHPVQVLLTLDPSSVDIGLGKRADQDYALAWRRDWGEGRVFYTALGHRLEVWQDELFQELLLDGIEWAIRGPDFPIAAPPAAKFILHRWKQRDGKDARWVVEDDVMEVTAGTGDLVSKDSYGDGLYHIEFMTPSMPTATGQERGNSGVYLEGLYEVQVLDSYGLDLTLGDCGAIYGKHIAAVNACRKPERWQTYDIEFTAPRFDSADKKTGNARMSVWQNGIPIHTDVEVDGPTAGGDATETPTGPLLLQDHGNPVRYRNVWVLPR